jgi:ubiquinone/menaquinone biosynthesis C-methylase UbiE
VSGRGRAVPVEKGVAEHYGREDLLEAITAAPRAEGKDPERLTVQDLAPFDQMHVRGAQATEELGAALALDDTVHVVDVGCGIGGPARWLAATSGCRITGLDLSAEYCRIAILLTQRVGLADRVAFRQGSALAMPFEDGSFDAAYSQHAAMNIADKRGLYGEVARVLGPGGRFGIYDLRKGSGGEVIYPTPWARNAAMSFLIGQEELRLLLEDSGFTVIQWRDLGDEGRVWAESALERLAGRGSPGLQRFRTKEFATMIRNLARNLLEERIFPIEVICRKGQASPRETPTSRAARIQG